MRKITSQPLFSRESLDFNSWISKCFCLAKWASTRLGQVGCLVGWRECVTVNSSVDSQWPLETLVGCWVSSLPVRTNKSFAGWHWVAWLLVVVGRSFAKRHLPVIGRLVDKQPNHWAANQINLDLDPTGPTKAFDKLLAVQDVRQTANNSSDCRYIQPQREDKVTFPSQKKLSRDLPEIDKTNLVKPLNPINLRFWWGNFGRGIFVGVSELIFQLKS